MKKHSGWTGSPNPRQGANPSNLANSTANRLVVIGLKRIAESQPTAWEGRTPEGHRVHIACLFGEVSVEIGCPCVQKPGWLVWKRVASFRPSLIEAEVEGQSDSDRLLRRLMAERAMVAEIRRSNEADMEARSRGCNGSDVSEILLNRQRLIIRDGQLALWMETRNRHLPMLRRRGLAGGSLPVEIRFHYDKE